MKIKPLHPTKEEHDEIFNPEGMRKRIKEYAFYDNMTRNVLEQAKHMELNTEDTMTMLAFHALSMVESVQEQLIRYLHTSSQPSFIIARKHQT